MKYSLLISLAFLFFSESQAETLKSLAIRSNHILVISHRLSTQKKVCSYDFTQISQLSQSLKAKVDGKIASLNKKDLDIIRKRLSTCASDCTCDIYSLALEYHSIDHTQFDKVAESLTAIDREKCFKKSGRQICKL